MSASTESTASSASTASTASSASTESTASTEFIQPKTRDAFTLLKATEIKCLDDGFVRLEDCMPRIIPKDRTMEVSIVKSARISYASGLKDKTTDDNLVRYLMRNRHTSPLESVKFTFHIRAPKFVIIHLLRHRTANVNEFSQRYSTIRENSFYHPSKVEDGIRLQSKTNKQGSVSQQEVNPEITTAMEETEHLLDEIYSCYQKLVKLGVSKEIARFCLPTALYSELYYTMDLNNLLKFLSLRMDADHAQKETVIYAEAMYNLVRPLLPVVMDAFDNFTFSNLILSRDEVAAIKAGSPDLPTSSESEKREFHQKLAALGLLPAE